jgi:hypothetical protein
VDPLVVSLVFLDLRSDLPNKPLGPKALGNEVLLSLSSSFFFILYFFIFLSISLSPMLCVVELEESAVDK